MKGHPVTRALCATFALAVVVVSGCAKQEAASPPGDSGALASAESSAALNSQAALRLAIALQDATLSESHAYEPSGDIAAGEGGPDRFYAAISDVSTGPASITFDAAQLYLGDEAMERDPTLPDPGLVIDEHRHSQTVAANADTVVVLQATHGSETDTYYGTEWRVGVTTVSFDEFARRFADDPGAFGESAGYIITLGDSGVSSIVQVYFP